MTQDVALDASAAVLPSTCTLYLGDCLDVMLTLAPASVAMVFADLPYGALRHYSWDIPISLDCLWQKLNPLRQEKCAIIFTASARLFAKLIISNSSEFQYDLIWKKHTASNFMMGKQRPLSVHEHLLVFSASKCTYNPQMRDESQRINKRQFKTPNKTSSWYSGTVKKMPSKQGAMYPISIIETSESKKGNTHPTQKPIALLEWLIKTYTNPGDTVLDPVFGSCTTGVACARLGRNFVGIEKDDSYFRMGHKRVDTERAKLGLDRCQVLT